MRYRHTGGANLVYGDGHAKFAVRGRLSLYNWQIGGEPNNGDPNIR